MIFSRFARKNLWINYFLKTASKCSVHLKSWETMHPHSSVRTRGPENHACETHRSFTPDIWIRRQKATSSGVPDYLCVLNIARTTLCINNPHVTHKKATWFHPEFPIFSHSVTQWKIRWEFFALLLNSIFPCKNCVYTSYVGVSNWLIRGQQCSSIDITLKLSDTGDMVASRTSLMANAMKATIERIWTASRPRFHTPRNTSTVR